MTTEHPGVRKRISSRKLTILGLLKAKNATGQEAQPISGRTRMQKLVFLVRNKVLNIIGDCDAVFNFDYNPVAEKYGPADLDLYQDLEFLHSMGLISIDGVELRPTSGVPNLDELRASPKVERQPSLPEEEEEYELSFEYLMGRQPEELLLAEAEDEDVATLYAIAERGSTMLQKIRDGLDKPEQKRFDRLIAACQEIRVQFGDLLLKSLLRYVYENFEQYIGRSTIRDEVLGRGGG